MNRRLKPGELERLHERQKLIRNYFLSKTLDPKFFCSYMKFCQVFPKPNIYGAYTSENLNVIDTHLRYHQNIFYEMAPYKWVPVLAVVIASRLSAASLIFPLFYTHMFDTYLKKYFIWKHRNDRNINIRKEFVTKLSKYKNKERRVILFDRINTQLGITEEQLQSQPLITLSPNIKSPFSKASSDLQNIPSKYIKFGESTPYIFHATTSELGMNVEESHLFVTPLFENYIRVKEDFLGLLKSAFPTLIQFKRNYSQFRKDYKENKQLYDKYLFIDTQDFLKFNDIKEQHIYSATNRVQYRIRRFLELFKYHSTGNFQMNQFTLSDWTHTYEHTDFLEQQRFNSQTNMSDIALFYGLVAIPAFFKFLLRRRVSL